MEAAAQPAPAPPAAAQPATRLPLRRSPSAAARLVAPAGPGGVLPSDEAVQGAGFGDEVTLAIPAPPWCSRQDHLGRPLRHVPQGHHRAQGDRRARGRRGHRPADDPLRLLLRRPVDYEAILPVREAAKPAEPMRRRSPARRRPARRCASSITAATTRWNRPTTRSPTISTSAPSSPRTPSSRNMCAIPTSHAGDGHGDLHLRLSRRRTERPRASETPDRAQSACGHARTLPWRRARRPYLAVNRTHTASGRRLPCPSTAIPPTASITSPPFPARRAATRLSTAEVLGLRLVKKTVNFDDPGTYHLYYGDAAGPPGTILTFFPWEHAAPGRLGVGRRRRRCSACRKGRSAGGRTASSRRACRTRRSPSASANRCWPSRIPTA
jgi:hypothetical protein